MIINLAQWSRAKPPTVTYSGDYTVKPITVDGMKYILYTLIGSGTLTIDRNCPVDIWACGGGGLGSAIYRGGGGGYFAQKEQQWLYSGTSSTVTIGGSRGTTTFAQGGTTIATAAGSTNENGASGGGGGATGNGSHSTAGTGGGVSTRPFGDAVNFTNLPCAGGGGVGDIQYSGSTEIAWGYGGAGGSNGSNGSNAIRSTSSQKDCNGGAGGETGGGRGAHGRQEYYAANGSYYGAGAGGGWADAAHNRASGYQGVVFMRVPTFTYLWVGSPAICNPPAGTILNILELSWTPYQPGSGDPTPTNIRPISAMREITVTRLEDSAARTWTLSQTVVGGEIDASGTGTETWKIVTLDGTSVYFVAGTTENGKTYYNVSGFSLVNSTGNNAANYISSHFPPNTFNGNSSGQKLYTSSTAIGPYFSSVSELNNYLTQQYNAGTPVQVAYKLATANSFATTGGGSFVSIQGTNTLSSDGVTLTVFGTKRKTTNPTNAYQYYRLNMTGMMRGSASGTFFSLAEFELYNGSYAVSYTGAEFSASSSLSGYPVAQAFDGNASTLWHVDGSPSSAWIQVQLPAAAAITSFSITPRGDQNDRLDAFTLDASNDGSTWTTLYSAANQASGWTQGDTKIFMI